MSKNPYVEVGYIIDIQEWGIDGNPLNNRNGLQAAIDWAYTNKYRKVIFPFDTTNTHPELKQGIYTLEDGGTDPSRNAIHEMLNLKSNTIYDLNGCTLKIKPNHFNSYQIVTMRLTKNTILQNGFLLGDKNDHIYSGGTTHEWGYGIHFMGATNCKIRNVEITNMTGDAVHLADASAGYKPVNFTDMEVGSIDDNGNPVNDSLSLRTKTFIKYSDLYNSVTKTSMFDNGEEKSFALYAGNDHGYGSMGEFTVREVLFYFYDSNYQFLTKTLGKLSSHIRLPFGAEYLKFSFPSREMETFTKYKMTVLRETRSSELSYVEDCILSDCRRQGVSISSSVNCGVKRTLIADIGGTAPSSCIDIEDGSHATEKIVIEDCIFKNSKWGVIFFDGHRHSMKNCVFEGNEINITNTYATGVTIENCNVFDGRVFLGRTTEVSNGYSPLSLTVKDCLFRSCMLQMTGNIDLYNSTFVNVDLRSYNSNNNMFDCKILNDKSYKYQSRQRAINLKNIKIYRTSFHLTNNSFYEELANVELIDCTYSGNKLILTNKVIMNGCTIETQQNASTFFEQWTEPSYFYAENTIFNLNSKKFGFNVFNFSLKNCTINNLDPTSHYGLAFLRSLNGSDVKVTLEDCFLPFPNNKRFLYWTPTNGEKLELRINNCHIINTSTKDDLKITTNISPTDIKYLEIKDSILEKLKCDFRNEDLEEDVQYL
jgi:hypothetical protein